MALGRLRPDAYDNITLYLLWSVLSFEEREEGWFIARVVIYRCFSYPGGVSVDRTYVAWIQILEF